MCFDQTEKAIMTLNMSQDLIQSKFINSFLNLNIAEPLYHYTSEYCSELIKNSGKIWLSRFDNSNDDLEFRHGLQLTLKHYASLSKKDSFTKALFEKYISFLNKEIRDPKMIFMMVCFSKSRRSQHLWWKYGNKKSGHCLEFKFDQHEINAMGAVICREVFYSKKRFKKLAFKLIREYSILVKSNLNSWLNDDTYESNMHNVMLSMHKDIFILSSFCKIRKFRNEKEYRLAVWIPATSKNIKTIGKKQIIEMDIGKSLINLHRHSSHKRT